MSDDPPAVVSTPEPPRREERVVGLMHALEEAVEQARADRAARGIPEDAE